MNLNFEPLFESIKLISENVVKDIKFDLTKFCTIVDDSEKKLGKYLVEENSTRFYAISDSEEYKKGDKIRVSIPNGDFDNTKYIIGKVVSKDSEDTLVDYVSPLETVIDISGNLFENKGTWSIKANGKERIKLLGEINLTEFLDLQNRNIYETLSISADFRTLLSEYRIISGTFGICAILYNEENQPKPIGRIDLDSSIMFGNPYRFGIYTKQENKGDIRNAGNISKIQIFLYQNGDFKYLEGEEEKEIDEESFALELDNIWVKNIYISFGSEVSNIADNTLVIYTDGSLNYNSDILEENYNRNLRIIWYNKNEETNEYIGFGDVGDDIQYNLYWYKYTPNFVYDEKHQKYPKLPNWEPILSDTEKSGLPVKGEIKPSKDDYFEIELNDEIREDKYKAILKITQPPIGEEEEQKIVTLIESNVLIFTNTGELVDTLAADANNGALYIEHGANSQAVYPFYDEVNIIDKSYEALRQRELYIRFNGLSGKDEQIDGAMVYWYVPKALTMLSFDEESLIGETGGLGYTKLTDNTNPKYKENYICYYKTLNKFNSTDTEGEGTGGLVSRTFLYKVKDYYTPSYKNNTIICEVVRRKITFKTEISFTFSTKGIAGTDYTLVVAPIGKQQAATAGSDFKLGISLYNPSGNIMQIDSDPELTWEGVSKGWGHTRSEIKDNTWVYNITAPVLGFEDGLPILKINVTAALDFSTETEGVVERRNLDLITYYPMSYTNGNYYANSPNFITYRDNSINPSYQKDPYQLFDDMYNPLEADWESKYFSYNGTNDVENEEIPFLPSLTESNSLLPKNLYISNPTGYLVVWGKTEDPQAIWGQAVKVLKNRYLSTTLNQWNGELKVDKEENLILSAMVGAGKKNKDNSFSGVVMGEFGKLNDDTTGLGLRGYHEGEKSFDFDVNGTATLGKSGRGQIKFDGNESTIKSASYEVGKSGMLLDLDNGVIDLRGIDGNYSNIHIDIKNPYFRISSPSNEDKNLIYISSDEDYYLQSENYKEILNGEFDLSEGEFKEEDEGQGTRLNLSNGVFDSYGLTLRSKYLLADSKISDENEGPFFVLKNPSNRILMYAGTNSLINEQTKFQANSNFFIKSPNYSYLIDADKDNLQIIKHQGTLLDLNNGFFTTDHFYITGEGKRFKINESGEQEEELVLKLILESRNFDRILTTYDEKDYYGLTIDNRGNTKIGEFTLRKGFLGAGPSQWSDTSLDDKERIQGVWGYYIPNNFQEEKNKVGEITNKLIYKDRNTIIDKIIWSELLYFYVVKEKFIYFDEFLDVVLQSALFKELSFLDIEANTYATSEYAEDEGLKAWKEEMRIILSGKNSNTWEDIKQYQINKDLETISKEMFEEFIKKSIIYDTLNIYLEQVNYLNNGSLNLKEYYAENHLNIIEKINENLKNGYATNGSTKDDWFISFFYSFGLELTQEDKIIEDLMALDDLESIQNLVYSYLLDIAKGRLIEVGGEKPDSFIDIYLERISIKEACTKLYYDIENYNLASSIQESFVDWNGQYYALGLGGTIAKAGMITPKETYNYEYNSGTSKFNIKKTINKKYTNFFPMTSHPFRVTRQGDLFIGDYKLTPRLVGFLLEMAKHYGYTEEEKYENNITTGYEVHQYPVNPEPQFTKIEFRTGKNGEYTTSNKTGFWTLPERSLLIEGSAIRISAEEVEVRFRLTYTMLNNRADSRTGYKQTYMPEINGNEQETVTLKGTTPEKWYGSPIVKGENIKYIISTKDKTIKVRFYLYSKDGDDPNFWTPQYELNVI